MPDFAYRRPALSRTGLSILLVTLAAGPGYGGAPRPDAWESRPPPGLQDCVAVDAALISPVPVAHRPAAIARLRSSTIFALDRRQVRVLFGLAPSERVSGVRRLEEAIADLARRRRAAHRDRVGSWSRADQQRLGELRRLRRARATATLRPFLVRAVAKHEGTGTLSASVCKDSLVITHNSLGRSTPPSTRQPIVVFLDRAPTRVYVDWAIDE
jgi:hypothetical protein